MSEYVKSLRRKGLYGIADYVERLEKAANPVRHGKWINTRECDEWYAPVHKCSLCGGETLGDKDKYCSSCGAKMDGDVNGKSD